MPQISVIVPVYRVEKYLARCVDSVLNQTFRDFDLILVDDGSPDQCPAICDAYAKKDSRIHVIHQKNGGLSAARNAGLDYIMDHSDSQWVTFLDSDDWLHPGTLEALLDAAVSNQKIVSICGFERTEGLSPEVTESQLVSEIRNTRAFYQEDPILLTVAWGKLYKKDCFREIRFPVGKLHEDEFTTYRVLFTQESIAYVPAPMYAYYVNPESITGVSWNPRRMEVWEAFRQQIRFFDDRGDRELGNLCHNRYLKNAFIQLQQLENLDEPGELSSYLPEIKEKVCSLLHEGKQRKCLDFERDFPILIRFHPVKTQMELYRRAIKRRLERK